MVGKTCICLVRDYRTFAGFGKISGRLDEERYKTRPVTSGSVRASGSGFLLTSLRLVQSHRCGATSSLSSHPVRSEGARRIKQFPLRPFGLNTAPQACVTRRYRAEGLALGPRKRPIRQVVHDAERELIVTRMSAVVAYVGLVGVSENQQGKPAIQRLNSRFPSASLPSELAVPGCLLISADRLRCRRKV